MLLGILNNVGLSGLQKEGCKPNVVTYNTLIDVFGKMGRWEDAVRVLDDMAAEVSSHGCLVIWLVLHSHVCTGRGCREVHVFQSGVCIIMQVPILTYSA